MAAPSPTGELRLYLETHSRVVLQDLQSALAYSFAYEREHRTESDPWEYAFTNPQRAESESAFELERDRVIHALLSVIPGDWDADLMYYAPGQSGPAYHWSSSGGTLDPPYQT